MNYYLSSLFYLSHDSDDHQQPYQPYHDDGEGYEGNYSYNYGYNPYRPPSGGIKGKVEQKYWHTKQTVIQKLGKEQDCYVVAGDAEVDARLEVRKLRDSIKFDSKSALKAISRKPGILMIVKFTLAGKILLACDSL